jgi:two-component system sensor histidine kinase/response regulator
MKNLFENTILIVDDTPENIDILVELLEDFEKQIAINGLDALETAFENPPDLILLDIMMPEMSGYEVCEKLREDVRTKDIPVIFLTAKALKEDVVKGFEVGGQDYITKPFDFRELMERVKTQLELKTQREVLKNMNIILEEKVQERTVQLDKANVELESANLELKVLDEAKNSFLTMISHEIRTPLNGIIGGVSILKDFNLPEETLDFLELLEASIKRLEAFTMKTLEISQFQTRGKEMIELETFNFRELLQDQLTKMEPLINGKMLKTSLQCDADLQIYADNHYINMAIAQLLDNAIYFSQENGIVEIIVEQDKEEISCTISDQGCGFPEYMLGKAIKSFQGAVHNIDEKTGLSLYLTNQIVEAHNGSLSFGNRKEGGAFVKMVIPVK